MTDKEWGEIAPYVNGSREYYESLEPDYEGAKYTVCANIYSEQCNDYIAHYDGHVFDNFELAYDYWASWMPDMDEVRKAVREDHAEYGDEEVSDHYELEVAIWDERGECGDDYFWNETIEGWQ